MRRDTALLGVGVAAFVAWLIYSAGNSSGDDMFTQVAKAIYDFEDPNKNQAATRNNNPGNMRPPDGSANYWPGQTGVETGTGFAIFDSLASGFDALKADLVSKASRYPNWSIQDLFNRWLGGAVTASGHVAAPPVSEGNAVTYALYVANKIGVSVATTLGTLATMVVGG